MGWMLSELPAFYLTGKCLPTCEIFTAKVPFDDIYGPKTVGKRYMIEQESKGMAYSMWLRQVFSRMSHFNVLSPTSWRLVAGPNDWTITRKMDRKLQHTTREACGIIATLNFQ